MAWLPDPPLVRQQLANTTSIECRDVISRSERWERSSEHVVDGLATLGASTLTVPTGRVATAPLLLPYKPAAAAMRMHPAGDAAVHVITGQQHGNCCHFSSRPSFEAGFASLHAA